MTHRGPFQPLTFCDSVILTRSCDLPFRRWINTACMLQLHVAETRRGFHINLSEREENVARSALAQIDTQTH